MIKMRNISRQFAVLATNFRHNYFLQTRLKLTAFYTVVVLLIMVIFSVLVYGLFAQDIASNVEYESKDNANEAIIEVRIIDKAKDRLQTILIIVDSVIIILVSGLGYYLAGKTLRPIEKSLEQQKKFVADSAHELRTPLAVMKTGIQAVSSSCPDLQEYKKLSGEMLVELDYLTNMVNDLLFLAHSDNSAKHGFAKLDLTAAVNRQVKFMQIYATTKKVQLNVHIKGDFYILGEGSQIKRLLVNLIKNAVDYNRIGGRVDFFLDKKDRHVILTIADTGIGIPAEKLKNIFDRFYKVDQARSANAGGAGLGLSIVREIIKTHKGNIKVKSKIDKGTEVIISFPVY